MIFLEFSPNLIANNQDELFFYKESRIKYIETVWKFFYKNIKYDKTNNKLSSLFQNVRLHYIDIRTAIWYVILPLLEDTIEALTYNFDYVHKLIVETVNIIIELLKRILHVLKNKDNLEKINIKSIYKFNVEPHVILQDSIKREKYFDHLIYLMSKFLNNYNNQNVKNTIYNLIDEYLIPQWEGTLNDFNDLYDEIKRLDFESYQNNRVKNRFINEFKSIYNYIKSDFHLLVDLYFMRRFLDKKYITNAIVYSGAVHSVVYVYMLNKIGFKITNCANCITQNMSELDNIIAEVIGFPSDYSVSNELLKIFVNDINNPIQCSDLANFPNNFL